MNRNHQQGMSLLELMIAMTLGLMLTLGIGSLFMQTRASFGQDEQIANMQANMRFAMEVLVRDIAMAGYYGGVHNPTQVNTDPSLVIAGNGDCGPGGAAWAYIPNLNTAAPVISGLNDVTPAAANAAYSCISAEEFATRTDVIAIKRVIAHPVMNATNLCVNQVNPGDALVQGTVYLADNGTTGLLFRAPMTGPGLGGCVHNRRYHPVVYYIRNHSITPGDGIPTLCRKVLDMSGTPSMNTNTATECLAEGIEQLQIQYGIDTSGNGVANTYLSAPNAVQIQQVTAVRVHILARSIVPQQGYTNNKTYVLGDRTFAPGDNLYRRAASTTVLLRNPANLRSLGN